MAYYPDLSQYEYSDGLPAGICVKNIGWLDIGHEFSVAPPSNSLLDALWRLAHISVFPTRGMAFCHLCHPKWSDYVCYSGEQLVLGSAEMALFGEDGKLYVAPNLLFHYVHVHSYSPPAEFVEAVMRCDRMPEGEYPLLVDRLGVKWEYTSTR